MTAISIQEFYAERGSAFSEDDAKKIGPALQELAADGDLKEETVVEVARSANSPLNAYFEWNDQRAAHQYRLGQARDMMHSIRVRYEDGSGKQRVAKAFQIARPKPRAESTRKFKVLDDDSAFAAQMMDAALDDLKGWSKKYSAYLDTWDKFAAAFQGIVNQIGEFEEEARDLSLSAGADDALAELLAWRERFKDDTAAWPNCQDQIGFLLEAIGTAEAAVAKLNTLKTRNCIRCTSEFKSTHVGNRMCPRCLSAADGLAEAG